MSTLPAPCFTNLSNISAKSHSATSKFIGSARRSCRVVLVAGAYAAPAYLGMIYAMLNRSRFITLVHAAAKSRTNFSEASDEA